MAFPDGVNSGDPFAHIQAQNAALMTGTDLTGGGAVSDGIGPPGLVPEQQSIDMGLPAYLLNPGQFVSPPVDGEAQHVMGPIQDEALQLAGLPPTKSCPECDMKIPKSAKKCWKCKHVMTDEDGDEKGKDTDKDGDGHKLALPDMKKCKTCKWRNPKDAKKCKKCGKALDADGDEKGKDNDGDGDGMKMSAAVIYNVQGLNLSRQTDDGLVWKVACKTGTLALSPGPGQMDSEKPLVLDDSLFNDMLLSFQEKAFPYITVPETHGNGSLENTGYVRQAEVLSRDQLLADTRLPKKYRKQIGTDDASTRYLLAGIEFTEPHVKEKALRGSIPDTSIGVKFGYRNKRTGKLYKAAWEHLALTPMPWVDGLVPFGLSQGDAPSSQSAKHYDGVFVERPVNGWHEKRRPWRRRRKMDLGIINFDPNLHPRDMNGRWREIVGGLKPGQIAKLPDGTTVKAVRSKPTGADRAVGKGGTRDPKARPRTERIEFQVTPAGAKSGRGARSAQQAADESLGHAVQPKGSPPKDDLPEMQTGSTVTWKNADGSKNVGVIKSNDAGDLVVTDNEGMDWNLDSDEVEHQADIPLVQPTKDGETPENIRQLISEADDIYQDSYLEMESRYMNDEDRAFDAWGDVVDEMDGRPDVLGVGFQGIVFSNGSAIFPSEDGDGVKAELAKGQEAADTVQAVLEEIKEGMDDGDRTPAASDLKKLEDLRAELTAAFKPKSSKDDEKVPYKSPPAVDLKGPAKATTEGVQYRAQKYVDYLEDPVSDEDLFQTWVNTAEAMDGAPGIVDANDDSVILEDGSVVAPSRDDQDAPWYIASYPAGSADAKTHIEEAIMYLEDVGSDESYYEAAQNKLASLRAMLGTNLAQDGRDIEPAILADLRNSGGLDITLSVPREETSTNMTVEELLAEHQVALEEAERRIEAQATDLALAQGTIAAQSEQLHADAVAKKVKALQAEGYDPALCLAVKAIMLADKGASATDGGLNLSVQAGDKSVDLKSATDIADFLLSAVPPKGGVGAGVLNHLSELHASQHEEKNPEQEAREAVDAYERERHPDRFDAEGNRL